MRSSDQLSPSRLPTFSLREPQQVMNGSHTATEEADQSLSQSHRLVEARTRFNQLSKEHQLSQFRLQAHRQAQQAITGWSQNETSQEKQSRLEMRIQEVEKELQTRRNKRAICQGVVTA